MAKLYNDSKTFVDMKMKEPPQETLEMFRQFMSEHDEKPTKEDIRKFVNVRPNLNASFFSHIVKIVDRCIFNYMFFFVYRIILKHLVPNLWIGSQMTGKNHQHFWNQSKIPTIANGLPI